MNSTVMTTPATMEVWGTTEAVGVKNTKENYAIEVRTSRFWDQLELAEISVNLPTGNQWIGNIQDFTAIESYAKNAFRLISKYGIGTGEELKELQTLLQHFNPGQPPIEIPAPGETQDRGKEMAMISCIMTNNCFDKMVASPDGNGVINCYDLVAQWAAEFYDKYHDHDWENVTAEFPNATGWEDTVVAFALDKMKSFYIPEPIKRKHKVLVTLERAATEYLSDKGYDKFMKSKKFSEGTDYMFKYFDTEGEWHSYSDAMTETNGYDMPISLYCELTTKFPEPENK